MDKKILVSFSALSVLIVLIFSNSILSDAHQIIGYQKDLAITNTDNYLDNKIIINFQVSIYGIDLSNLSAEVDTYVYILFPYERAHENLTLSIEGGGYERITCTLMERTPTRTSYTGSTSRTKWLIGGKPELYPFDTYYLNFAVHASLAYWEYYYGFTLENNSGAYFLGDERRALEKTFKTIRSNAVPVAFENEYRQWGDEEWIAYPKLIVYLERREWHTNSGALISLPIFFAYFFLVSSFLIKVPDAVERKKGAGVGLRNRLTIYLALFAFSIGSFFSIRSLVPYPAALSLVEIFVINLSICVSLSGIFSIVSEAFSKNLNFYALISCAIITFFVLWVPFLGSLNLPVLTMLLIPMLAFSMPALYISTALYLSMIRERKVRAKTGSKKEKK